MKRVLKNCALILVFVLSAAFMFAACGTEKSAVVQFGELYNVFSQKDNLVKNAKVLNLGGDATVVSYKYNDFVIYSQKDNEGKITYYCFDLKKELPVPNIFTNLSDNDIAVFNENKNFIAVTRSFEIGTPTAPESEQRTALYNKDGQILIDFSKNYQKSDFNAIGENVFTLFGDVYTVSGTTVKKVISNAFTGSINMWGEDVISVTVGRTTSYYDLNGKLLYSYAQVSTGTAVLDGNFWMLSAKKGLIMTRNAMPDNATNYTCLYLGAKLKVKYEIVEFATGKKKEVKFNYLIDEVTSFQSETKEYRKSLKEKALNYIKIEGFEIAKDKTLSQYLTTVITDSSLKVICAQEGFMYYAKLTEDRHLIKNFGIYQIVDSDGGVILDVGSSVYSYSNSFVSAYASGYGVYDLNGNLKVRISDYYGFDGINYGGYSYAEKGVTHPSRECIIVKYDGTEAKIGLPADLTVKDSFYIINSTRVLYNYAGVSLIDLSEYASINFNMYSYSSVNSQYFTITQDGKANQILKLYV